MTSNYSFSCANMFPFVAKENNAAKIIGERSGGGACCVYYSATPDGKTYRISSSAIRFAQKDNPVLHNDAGVTPDYEIDRNYFYNDTYLNNLVSSL